jgi:hypothetical protein
LIRFNLKLNLAQPLESKSNPDRSVWIQIWSGSSDYHLHCSYILALLLQSDSIKSAQGKKIMWLCYSSLFESPEISTLIKVATCKLLKHIYWYNMKSLRESKKKIDTPFSQYRGKSLYCCIWILINVKIF